MRKRTTSLAMLPILAIAASCGGSGGADSAAPAANAAAPTASKSLPSDSDIVAKAYDPDYYVPEGFFVDERAATETRSYTVHHVLDATGKFELCSDDMTEATAWEEADNASRAVNGQLVTIHETDRYFEFVRELDYNSDVGNVGDATSPGYGRVFKCSHTDRSGVDRNLVDGYSGVRHAQPVNAAELKDFSEYLWQFRFFNVKHKVVLDSYAESAPGDPAHTLLLGLVHSQGSGNCDRVEVVKWTFSADAASGEISRSFGTAREFEARVTGGVPELCD